MGTTVSPPGQASSRRFLASFVALSIISGVTIGTGRIVTTFYLLDLGVGAAEIGFIAALEALGKMALTLPAGFLIYRFGARRIYSTATIGSTLFTALTPLTNLWIGVAAMRTLVSMCVPFRVVSMNSAFLQRLQELGSSRAGWYRAAQNLGLTFLAPMLAAVLVATSNYFLAYLCVAASFAFMSAFSRTCLPADDPEQGHAGQPSRAIAGIKQLLAQRAVSESCLLEFTSHVLNALFATFIIVLAVNELQLSNVLATTLITLQGVACIAALVLLGPALRHVPARVSYVGAAIAAATSLLLLGFSAGFTGLACASVLLGGGSALIHLVNMKQLSSLHLSKSKLASIYNLSGMTGALFGATAGGVLGELIGMRGMFLAWIPILALATSICVAALRRRPASITTPVEGTS